MPVAVFLHARRRNRPNRRLRTATALISLLGAALVIAGAVALDGSPRTTAPPARAATAPPAAGTPTATAGEPVPATAEGAAPAGTAGHPPPSPAAAPPVRGAGAGAPIQKLFAPGSAPPPEPALLDIDNPASALVLVNKHRPLVPADYMPADLVAPRVPAATGEPALLRKDAALALERMVAAAGRDGVAITVMSSFRSHASQLSLYNSYAAQKGAAAADTSSARPGFSEHQTGLAVDIGDAGVPASCEFTWCMASSPAGLWVATHGPDYGFIVRYQLGLEGITGYLAEPWHLRFVGICVATDMRARSIRTYEQYLGLPGAPGYK